MAGTLYLIHFDQPYGHARHYLGWTRDLHSRLDDHMNGRGSRLLAVLRANGIGWRLVRTWDGDRDQERRMKKGGSRGRCCPICTAAPRFAKTAHKTVPAIATNYPTGAPMTPQPRATRSGLAVAALVACIALLVSGCSFLSPSANTAAVTPAIPTAQAGSATVIDSMGPETAPGPPPAPSSTTAWYVAPLPGAYSAVVGSITDGDTFKLTDGSKIRIISEQAPEATTETQPCGPEATAALTAMIPPGSTVLLAQEPKHPSSKQVDKDKYGRDLRHVWTSAGVYVNAQMIADGWAFADVYPNTDLYRDQFEAAEAAAHAAGNGLWTKCPDLPQPKTRN